MIVVIDNYDSFVYNLVQFIGCHEPDIVVLRNDAITPAECAALDADALVISPGPGDPSDAGISNFAIATLGSRMPVLGVCLGLQCIAEVYGGEIVRARVPMHGKLSRIEHCGAHLFAGLPNPLEVMRYHSLVADRARVPACLEITAQTEEGEIMGLRHRTLDVEGVQFHPESVFTQSGTALVANFVRRVQQRARRRAAEASRQLAR
ncbi:MAG TPA: aminodeoxychorismate/anthranilate synthase component II [Enhygromyxa sp.]|nr:aminodeoxychorismate/anthranilate synthase component II [Enhygromyxa sp.]